MRLVFFLITGALYAQQAPRGGLEMEWDVAAVLQEISAHADRLQPALAKIDARPWVVKGASDTYVAQLESCKEQSRALVEGAKALARKPEQLSVALEVYFRIHGLDTMINSLAEGMRKYQSPADAQTLVALGAEIGANRDRLQRYIVNLAAAQEQDLAVMDREAQRCRAALTQAPPKPVKKK